MGYVIFIYLKLLKCILHYDIMWYALFEHVLFIVYADIDIALTLSICIISYCADTLICDCD